MDIATSAPNHESLEQVPVDTTVVEAQPDDLATHIEESGSFNPPEAHQRAEAPHESAPVQTDPKPAAPAASVDTAVTPAEPVDQSSVAKDDGEFRPSTVDLSGIIEKAHTYKAAQTLIEAGGAVSFDQAVINARIEGAKQNV